MSRLEIFGHLVIIDGGTITSPAGGEQFVRGVRAIIEPLPVSQLPVERTIVNELIAHGATIIGVPRIDDVKGRIY